MPRNIIGENCLSSYQLVSNVTLDLRIPFKNPVRLIDAALSSALLYLHTAYLWYIVVISHTCWEKGGFLVPKHFANNLSVGKGGKIINISSVRAIIGSARYNNQNILEY